MAARSRGRDGLPGRERRRAGTAFGEAVFTTAMTGYQEVVTDPSFCGQIVCFTAPMVGNYGVAERRSESARPHARAVVMREARGPEWTDWLQAEGIPALTGVDTRALVLHLRERGAMRGGGRRPGGEVDATLRRGPRAAVDDRRRARRARLDAASPTSTTTTGDVFASRSSTTAPSARSCGGSPPPARAVTVFPHDVDADTLAGFDGVLLSNGPGDPEPLVDEVATVRELLGRVPVLGICLGHQLLALATGLRTFKLPFGHRGANHPVLERATRARARHEPEPRLRGRAGRRAAAPTHESLYDGTVEGLAYPELRARSVQFHPEAGPGPHDAWPILAELGRGGAACRGVTTSTRSA